MTMNELNFKTPSQILEKLLDKSGNLNVEYLRLDTAIEAMKLYHNQFDNAQYVATPPPPVLTLEEKVLEAKGYGIKFVLMQENEMYKDDECTIVFFKDTTTADFEFILNGKLDYHRKRNFMGILTKHNLLITS